MFRIYTAGYKDIGIKIIEHRVQRAFISTMTKSHKGIESLPQTKIFESQPNDVNLWYFKLSLYDPIIHTLTYIRSTILSCQDIGD